MIAGRYEPLEGDLARDAELDRVVRLRWIGSVDEVDDPRLSDPGVVRVFDVGEHEGRRFAAIEHVDGVPLAAAAPLALDDAITLGVRASRALAAAHALGLVHTGEVLVRSDGMPKLSGFRPGEPGDDVRALAQALEDACPELPPVDADTPKKLERALNRARPQSTIPLPTLVLPHLPGTRRPTVLGLVAAALVALAIGLAAAFAGGGDGGPQARPTTRTVAVTPVPQKPDAEAQARALAAWLSRWSSP